MTDNNGLGTTLIAAALSIVLISNLIDLRNAHEGLEKAKAGQTAAIEGNKKVETQLDALAKGLNDLAQSGNSNASRIIATLKQNGININSGRGADRP